MSFGFEEKKVSLPFVEAKGTKYLDTPEYPKWKYHVEFPQGVLVQSEEEEASLGDGWANGMLELGIETHPSADKKNPVTSRIAEVRAAVESKKSKKSRE